MPRSLILEPTRELALQVAENFVKYGKYTEAEPRADDRRREHVRPEGRADARRRRADRDARPAARSCSSAAAILLNDCKVLVIDEADRMLDMGFIPDVERIVGLLPRTGRRCSSPPPWRRKSAACRCVPAQSEKITVSRSASVATTIVAGLALVAEHDKREALRRLIRTRGRAERADLLQPQARGGHPLQVAERHGFSVGALHGDMAQPVRFATWRNSRPTRLRLLVCSDVAARGLDIGGLSHVFNFDVPHHAEDYVHRIGRTGRAGREGHAYTLASPEDRLAVEAIEKLTGGAIPRIVVPGLDVVEWADAGRGARATASFARSSPPGPGARARTRAQ
jgi:superfamily II DNA/RNA helicase